MKYAIVINENMYDALASVVPEEDVYPLPGWERVWSWHDSQEAAKAELPAAEYHAAGRSARGAGEGKC